LENNENVNSSTYDRVEKNMKDVVKIHVVYMKKYKNPLNLDQKKLPFICWIPKMHKNPCKQRYCSFS
jgi:hypothetical protein